MRESSSGHLIHLLSPNTLFVTAWEDHPRRDHSTVLDLQSFFMDITPVTNEQ